MASPHHCRFCRKRWIFFELPGHTVVFPQKNRRFFFSCLETSNLLYLLLSREMEIFTSIFFSCCWVGGAALGHTHLLSWVGEYRLGKGVVWVKGGGKQERTNFSNLGIVFFLFFILLSMLKTSAIYSILALKIFCKIFLQVFEARTRNKAFTDLGLPKKRVAVSAHLSSSLQVKTLGNMGGKKWGNLTAATYKRGIWGRGVGGRAFLTYFFRGKIQIALNRALELFFVFHTLHWFIFIILILIYI